MPVARQQLARQQEPAEIVFIDDGLDRNYDCEWSSCHELPTIFKHSLYL